MYGDRVHQAVVEAGEKESGITIHRVNGQYDSGDIIAQHRVPLAPDDTPQEVAAKVHALEYEYYPQAVEAELCQIVVRFLQGKIIGASQSRKRETTYRSHAPKATKGANAPTDKTARTANARVFPWSH